METETTIQQAITEQIIAPEERKKSKRAGLWESHTEFWVGKLTIWAKSFEFKIFNRVHQVYHFHQNRFASPNDESQRKSPRTNTLADGLTERTSSMLDEINPA